MTSSHELPLQRLIRIGGVAIILSGLLMATGLALHPAGENATFGTDPMWVPAHALLWAAFTIAPLGWLSIHLAQAPKTGLFGLIGFVTVMIGTSLASWIFSSDVTFVPVIARQSPALFTEIFSSAHVAIGVASVLSWVLGNILVGASVIRAKMFSPWSGSLLIAGTAIIPVAYLTGASIRSIAFGGAITAFGEVLLGLALLRLARQISITIAMRS